MVKINIAGREIGEGKPTFIIAEAGVNHNGKLALAKKLVEEAKRAGADAVKFQTFSADRLVTKDAAKAGYQKNSGGGTQYEMLKQLELSEKDHVELFAHAKKNGIIFLSSPFDEKSADLLERLSVPAFKLGSGELTNLQLLKHVAKKTQTSHIVNWYGYAW